jgi:hypothetical protein
MGPAASARGEESSEKSQRMNLSLGSVAKTSEAQAHGNLTDRVCGDAKQFAEEACLATASPIATHFARPFLTIDAASLRLGDVIEISAG